MWEAFSMGGKVFEEDGLVFYMVNAWEGFYCVWEAFSMGGKVFEEDGLIFLHGKCVGRFLLCVGSFFYE